MRKYLQDCTMPSRKVSVIVTESKIMMQTGFAGEMR